LAQDPQSMPETVHSQLLSVCSTGGVVISVSGLVKALPLLIPIFNVSSN
jgi:hypothetical protein